MKLLKLIPVLAVALLAVSCGPALPQKDVDAAVAAFADAKTAQADVFAADAFKIANDANDALQANLTAKEYAKTADLAKAVVDASAKAKDAAAAGLETAKTEVTKLAAEVPVLAALVKKELDKAVKAGKKSKVDAVKAKADLEAADKLLADAQEAVKANNVGDSKVKLTAAQAAFAAIQAALEAAGFKA